LFVNIFLTGVAWQAGLIPISSGSIEQAIQLNGVDVEKNLQAFTAGRRFSGETVKSEGLVYNYFDELVAYQNLKWAEQWRDFVEQVRERRPELAETVAANLFKLMAYKDEYEVARLLTDVEFEQRTRRMWDGVESIGYNLHPPLLRAMGLKRKIQLGPWFRGPLRLLAKGKVLRGTPFDVFGYSRHRREERLLIAWYRELVEDVLGGRRPAEVLSLPDKIRGYEGIKDLSIRSVRGDVSVKEESLVSPPVR
jgi:indolepyruvate ferredoxin oxidoreductase